LVLAGTAVLTLHPRLSPPPSPAGPPIAGRPLPLSAVAPLDARRELAFDIADGADSITVLGADLGGDLYRVSAEPGAGPPSVTDSGTGLTLHVAWGQRAGHTAITVRLSDRVLWNLRLGGGATEHRVDMTGGSLAQLTVGGGATRIDLALPRPRGTVAVRLTSGAGAVVLRQPTGVPARVRMGRGAGAVKLDSTAVGPTPPILELWRPFCSVNAV
jgi:hypothetical protein